MQALRSAEYGSKRLYRCADDVYFRLLGGERLNRLFEYENAASSTVDLAHRNDPSLFAPKGGGPHEISLPLPRGCCGN
jgi:hypothetical protein